MTNKRSITPLDSNELVDPDYLGTGTPDGTTVLYGDQTWGSAAGVADILDIPTAETDDTLVLAPDGAGGVEFRAETGTGAPDTADYLVGTAQAGLSAEIVVGTTPGGELGGTWASPTVDATHSGSAHHAQDHASRHAPGGGDAVKLDDLDTPDDNTDLNSTTGHHGLLPKLPGGSTTFLREDGTWQTPSGTGAPTDADYLIGTAHGSLSGEIVVGTTPGGELGGTWASPTVDAIHSGSSHATATANAIGAYDIERYTAGDLTLNNTSMTAFSGPGDLVVAAASGDLLLLGISARTTNTTNASIGLDFGTIVSAAVVNFVSSLTGTALTTGVPAFFLQAGADGVHSGSHVYVVQSGDISGGNVTLRPHFRTSSSRVLAASSTVPLVFWVKNLKQ